MQTQSTISIHSICHPQNIINPTFASLFGSLSCRQATVTESLSPFNKLKTTFSLETRSEPAKTEILNRTRFTDVNLIQYNRENKDWVNYLLSRHKRPPYFMLARHEIAVSRISVGKPSFNYNIQHSNHTNVNDRNLKHCKLCNFSTRHGNLKRHMSIHTNEKRYNCTVEGCGRSFARSDTMKIHRELRHKIPRHL